LDKKYHEPTFTEMMPEMTLPMGYMPPMPNMSHMYNMSHMPMDYMPPMPHMSHMGHMQHPAHMPMMAMPIVMVEPKFMEHLKMHKGQKIHVKTTNGQLEGTVADAYIDHLALMVNGKKAHIRYEEIVYFEKA
jgi:hypothetical protein